MNLVVYLCLHVACALFLLCSTSCLGSQYENCISNNTCGSFQFSYPFGKNNSGCGDPRFQLECVPGGDQGENPLININGDEYHIMEPNILANRINNSMTIGHANYWGGKCNLTANYNSLWSGSYFHIRQNTSTNLSLWGYCDQSGMDNTSTTSALLQGRFCGNVWYYSLLAEAMATGMCEAHLQIPISLNLSIDGDSLPGQEQLNDMGFEITWDVDRNRDQMSGACSRSKGICGYDISQPSKFLCYCPDGSSQLDKRRGNGRKRKNAIVIGCSFGGVALTATVVLFFTCYAKRKRLSGSSNLVVEKFLKEYVHEMPTRYSHSHLKKITNNFREKLGEGGYGVVYKGKLRNGAPVAVKLLDRHRHSEIQFMNEVATIGRVHHFNLVRLVGYCFENNTSALVYEYMANGSLEKFIFARKEKGQLLSWEQLYSIALGAARGIAYLHQDCDKRIIHFDIKPHNILLDADFTPKVADFGLAKPYGKGEDHISMTAGRGTPGYVAPEVCDRDMGPVTDKSDVYSFGMLLLEIVGGRKNIHWKVSRSSQFYFPEWAFKLLEKGELGMRLREAGEGEMDAEEEEKARRLTKIGLWCIQYNSSDRPCMSRVVQMLEGNGDDVTHPPLPLNPLLEPENPSASSPVDSCEIELGT
eukprot:PITA_12665